MIMGDVTGHALVALTVPIIIAGSTALTMPMIIAVLAALTTPMIITNWEPPNRSPRDR